MPSPSRSVRCRLELVVTTPARLAVQVEAARSPGQSVVDRLDVTVDGAPLPAACVPMPHGGRARVVDAPVGAVTLSYDATIGARTVGRDDADAGAAQADTLTYLWPSRYCPSDALSGFAGMQFGVGREPATVVADIVDFVAQRLAYVPGSSGPADSAVQTLLMSQGVCRDYAHLVIALCRALDVPARLVAVYAPGLWPMDFHAVAEAYVDGRWAVYDATRLAPRSSLVRLATGRDAADTAFLSVYGGLAELVETDVTAVVDGLLPTDDHAGRLTLG